MSGQGRTEKSMMNVLTGVFGQMFSFVLSFAIRTVFIKTLGEVYLGINGLFSNILSVLNLTELGLGTAIVIELYRTVAQKDEEKTKQYLELYRKAYLVIGIVIFTIGLALTPFLNIFIKDSGSVELINIRLVFILYLINTTFSYFVFAYRQSILQANQEEYKVRIITYIFKFLEMFLQIIFLIVFKNIYVYLIIPIVLGCVSTVLKGVLIGKWHPIVREKPQGKLSKEEIKTTARNIGAVAIYKISGTVINSTDNIILSSFISIILTGLYSNYLIIVSAIKTMLEKLFSAFTASLGNLNVDAGDDLEKKHSIFNTLSFLNFWIYGFCTVAMFALFEPFIKLWIGERYILNFATEAMIALNLAVMGLQETVGTHRAAYGLFYKGRYRPFFSILLNIVLSILFVKILPDNYGVVGVLLGTVLSNLLSSWWYDALIIHKYAFNCSPKKYYIEFWLRLIYISVCAVVFRFICSLIDIAPIVDFILGGIICTLLYNFFFFLLFWKKEEFKYFSESLKRILNKFLRRKTV